MQSCRLNSLLILIATLVIISCGKGHSDLRLHPEKEPENRNEPGARFERLSAERTGILFTPAIQDEHRYNFMGDPYIYNGGGVSVIDVNNDGLQDLFFTNRLQGCRLYLNKGGMRFEDISESSGVAKFSGLKTGSVIVDINADGWPDIYVCRTWLEPLPDRRNLLFINNKDNTFSEQAAAYHLDDLSASQHANFFDADLDGDLDCYILNHPVDFKTMNNLDDVSGDARHEQPRNEWESDRLLLNENGIFRDVTRSAGIQNRAFGLSTITADFNDDGWPDIFVGNDFVMPDFLYINNHNGTFTDQAARYFRHTSNHTMGADYADLNNDGFGDLISLDMLAAPVERRLRLMNTMQRARDQQMQSKGYGRQVMRNTVQLSNGRQGFSEIGCMTGMYATDWSWAPLIADYDLDGKPDVFISNGIQRDLNDLDFFVFTADSINRSGGISKSRFPDFNRFAEMMPSHPVHNYLFRNLGALQFADVSEKAGFTQPGFSNGAAYADLDNDGDLDLITNNLQAPPAVYENKANENGNHWLQIKCKGTAKNPFGLGAKVRVYDDSGNQLFFEQEMTNVRGFYSSVEPIFEIGLGENTTCHVEIDWLEGKFQMMDHVAGNQRLILDISAAAPGKCPKHNSKTGIEFDETAQFSGLKFTHHENDFEDFDREKLLPYRLSRQGPALAVADLNGDQLDDVFIGGARGQSGTIFIQQTGGHFEQSNEPALEADRDFEDVDALFADFDGDGDADLYVVSGGNESPGESEMYQDRLYLNDGKGQFSRMANALPTIKNSGKCILSIDYDHDGDPDLIRGAAPVPGQYPKSGANEVLNNNHGVFTSVKADPIAGAGALNALAMADLNGDGNPEIIAAGEWTPVEVFSFQNDTWQNLSAQYDLMHSTGLWRSLAIGDMDGDGDLDLIAGNIGLNTSWKARPGAPLRLFAADMDKNGILDPILALAENGSYHPFWQRETMAGQIPSIKKKFPRNGPYASAALENIFDPAILLSGLCLEAETLESSWFENKNGKFIRHQLPESAQIAPAETVLWTDITGDQIPDLIVAGNDYGMNIETYQLDGSDGYVFPGKKNGGFENMPVLLGVMSEARKMAAIKGAGNRTKLIIVNNNGPVHLLQASSSKN